MLLSAFCTSALADQTVGLVFVGGALYPAERYDSLLAELRKQAAEKNFTLYTEALHFIGNFPKPYEINV